MGEEAYTRRRSNPGLSKHVSCRLFLSHVEPPDWRFEPSFVPQNNSYWFLPKIFGHDWRSVHTGLVTRPLLPPPPIPLHPLPSPTPGILASEREPRLVVHGELRRRVRSMLTAVLCPDVSCYILTFSTSHIDLDTCACVSFIRSRDFHTASHA